ncbi:hypothetical protein N7603_03570 [Acholeplasma vituli]|uniref:DUF4760 domain-containing protein n=1 Tax=Paracholeplasma vituli TaxID=69473 RepID=A0ABT2PUU9_9MOLU|nr:hypothetical protein [Paracholeplasma vituli]MCU0104729.1 hypothetical protein [Paracholeplasma vituli]
MNTPTEWISALAALLSVFTALVSFFSFIRFSKSHNEIEIMKILLEQRNNYFDVVKDKSIDKKSNIYNAAVENFLNAFEYAVRFYDLKKINQKWFILTFKDDIKLYLTENIDVKKIFEDNKTDFKALNKFLNTVILNPNK